MFRKLTPADYLTTAWSGGTTTQLAIFPETARYADRDFLWRISSATVDLEVSDFTPLPDYDRHIATLEGEITLTHNGGAPLTLVPGQVHSFSGGDETHCLDRCRDFNLMLRKGRAAGAMEAIHLTDSPTALNTGTSPACPPSSAAEQILLYCVSGSVQAAAGEETCTLTAGESLLTDLPAVTLTPDAGEARLMLCRMGLTEAPGVAV